MTPASGSLEIDIEWLARLKLESPEVFDAVLADMSEEDAYTIYCAEKYNWSSWARVEQLTPAGNWRFWICIAGRAGGKTRTGAQWVIEKAWQNPGCHIGLLGATAADVRDVQVRAILECSPPWFLPIYSVSNRRLTWPNGTYATTYSADDPDQTRGANLGFGWSDELAKYHEVKGGDVSAWENFIFAVRIGVNPQIIVTTTPRRVGRGAELVKDLALGKKVDGKRPFSQPPGDPAMWWPRENTVVHKWSTDRNRHNVAASFLSDLDDQYNGTALEAQERRGDLLHETDGALWTLDGTIAPFRVRGVPRLTRLLIAIDPSHSESGAGDEAGIIVGGLGENGHAYIMADCSKSGSPLAWAMEAIGVYNRFRADGIVYESNTVQTEKFANVVKDTIKTVDPDGIIKWMPVRATRDKATRAEPVAALYEQGRVHHVGVFEVLEDEMVSWDRTSRLSPNRMDALVWLIYALLLEGKPQSMRLL